jgi:hypothetical protein
MIELHIDADDLLKWSRYLREISERTPAAIARGMNTYGQNVARAAVQFMSQTTGVDYEDINNLVHIKEATPEDLTWELDASNLVPPSLDWSRPWDTPDDGSFDTQTLVKIVTMQDDLVCPICKAAAENSPYTVAEAEGLRQGYDIDGFLHPHCRCGIQPWESSRALPATFGADAPEELTPGVLGRRMGRQILDEVETEFKAVVK